MAYELDKALRYHEHKARVQKAYVEGLNSVTKNRDAGKHYITAEMMQRALQAVRESEKMAEPESIPLSFWQRVGEFQPIKSLMALFSHNPGENRTDMWDTIRAQLEEINSPQPPEFSELQEFHSAYKARSISSDSFLNKMNLIGSHPGINLLPVQSGKKTLLDSNPEYNVVIDSSGSSSYPTITFFGIQVNALRERFVFNGREYQFTEINHVTELAKLIDTWYACVKFALDHGVKAQKTKLAAEINSHPLLKPRMDPVISGITFETNRMIIRDLLLDYHKRKPNIHPDLHKEFEFRVLEPLRRIDLIVAQEQDSVEITELVQLGYRVLRDAENTTIQMNASRNNEEASVIFKVAMDRINSDLLPKLMVIPEPPAIVSPSQDTECQDHIKDVKAKAKAEYMNQMYTIPK